MRRSSSLLGVDTIIERKINDKYDNVAIVAENIDAITAVNGSLSSINTANANLTNINKVANNITDVIAVADNQVNIDTVVTEVLPNIVNVGRVGNNIDSVNAAANSITEINVVAADLLLGGFTDIDDLGSVAEAVTVIPPNGSSNINVVANNIADVVTVSNNIADVILVGDNIDRVNLVAVRMPTIDLLANEVAGLIAIAQQVVPNINEILLVDDRTKEFSTLGYLGGKATAPTIDNYGLPLVEGVMYWNTTTGILYVQEQGVWIEAVLAMSSTQIIDVLNASTSYTLDMGGL